MDVELNQSDCFKMMSFIKTANQIALKVQHPLCLHKNLPLEQVVLEIQGCIILSFVFVVIIT